jgi:adenylate cyclase class 2
MAVEIETKFVLTSFATVREALTRTGGRRLSRLFEENLVLDTGDGALRRQGMLLRLRRDDQGRVTLKLPGESCGGSGLKIRQEFETEVGDLDVLETIFGHLGFGPALRYEKIRETWALGNVHVCLDRLPFGRYLEIEGPAASIPWAAALLGLSMETALTATYHDLFRAHLAENGLPAADSFVFDPPLRRELLASLADALDR